MERSSPLTRSALGVKVTERDILFECPSCAKSLVVDQSAEGMIVECPQCRISVIVPPKNQPPEAGPPPHAPAAPAAVPTPVPHPPSPALSRPTPPVVAPEPKPIEDPEMGGLRDRLGTLSSQLREVQTQWTEITNRIAARINEVNRELVVMGRLEISQKQILNEWTQVVRKIADASQTAAEPPAEPPAPPAKSRGGPSSRAKS